MNSALSLGMEGTVGADPRALGETVDHTALQPQHRAVWGLAIEHQRAERHVRHAADPLPVAVTVQIIIFQ